MLGSFALIAGVCVSACGRSNVVGADASLDARGSVDAMARDAQTRGVDAARDASSDSGLLPDGGVEGGSDGGLLPDGSVEGGGTCVGPGRCLDPECRSAPECAACSGIESCHDGVDNDCDGLVDCADPDCADYYLCPHSCPEVVLPAPCLDPPFCSPHQWNTSDQHDDTTGSCGGAGAPDIAFLYTASVDGLYAFTTGGLFDTVLYVLDGTDCHGAELACNDNQPGTLDPLVQVRLHAGQQVVVVVDGASTGDVGRTVLGIYPPRPDAGTP